MSSSDRHRQWGWERKGRARYSDGKGHDPDAARDGGYRKHEYREDNIDGYRGSVRGTGNKTERRHDSVTGSHGGFESDREGQQKERHPPGLRGREIGMWYARRSKARVVKEQKLNRPTVAFDMAREKNIRELLSNMKKHDDDETCTSSHFQSAAASSCPDEDMESAGKVEPPESWESLDGDISDSDTKLKCEPDVQIKACPQEKVLDLDEYDDDDGQTLASVAGVVEYMKLDSDFPFVDVDPDSDFQNRVTDDDCARVDRELADKLQQLQNDPGYMRMLGFRKKLPAYEMKDVLISAINKNQVLVVSGETGCGKTTQVPQFILDDFISRGTGSKCQLICTQPRRISAISVAERVAAERCEKVDETGTSSVGYQIRLEAKRPCSQGSILFCTTGIILKFLESDPFLHRASHVIMDEVHERDLHSDFLMIILKDLLPRRPDLKLILMSATLNAEMFSHYFNGCPMINIPGYMFPVKEYLLEDVLEMTGYVLDDSPQSFHKRRRRGLKPEEMKENNDYQVWCRNLTGRYSQRTIKSVQEFDHERVNLDLILHILNFICSRMEEGAVLVFVPGWEEIRKLHDMVQSTARYKSGSLKVIPLHSLMPTVNQREVFDRPQPGVRKIVIATNIAETSITIDDIVFVVDCGKIKVKSYQPEINLTSLQSQWVAKANAKQRKGRAGRVQPGHCFHLYTKFHHDNFQDYHPPEIMRTGLEELCLQIKLLHLGRIVPFVSKAMQHPSMEAITSAIQTLTELNALDKNEELLPLGYHLARMPMEPHMGKMVLFAAMFSCLDPILTVAASLSFKQAFVIPLGKEEVADRVRVQLAHNSKSDHIMLINAYKGWEQSLRQGSSRSYCWENFLSENTLHMLKDMKKQLAELVHELGFVATKNPKDQQANMNSENLSLIRAVLCAGLYPSVGQVMKVPKSKSPRYKGVSMQIKDGSQVYAHPKSVNYSQTTFESKWVVFHHKLKTSRVYIHDSTMVSPYALLFFGGEVQIIREDGTELICIDDWIRFRASVSTAQLVKDLRQQLDRLLLKKITCTAPTVWDKSEPEGALMTAIVDLITQEELTHPTNSSNVMEGSRLS